MKVDLMNQGGLVEFEPYDRGHRWCVRIDRPQPIIW
jgi:hypothetical protein